MLKERLSPKKKQLFSTNDKDVPEIHKCTCFFFSFGVMGKISEQKDALGQYKFNHFVPCRDFSVFGKGK